MPRIDLARELHVQQALLSMADETLLRSAHDCSDGGIAVALAECCFSSNGRRHVGAEIELTSNDLSSRSMLFGETPSRIIISFDPERLERVRELAGDCPLEVIGRVGGDVLQIAVNGDQIISSPIIELESVWKNALGQRLDN